MNIRRTPCISLIAGTLLGLAACTSPRQESAAPAALAAPSTAEPGAPLAPSMSAGGQLAALSPSEIRVMMVDLNLARALDLCGFPALGGFIRDYAQQRIDSCPNSAERKTAFRSLLESARLREQRLADEARAQGVLQRCQQPDKLQAIKEMIPVAQRLAVAADHPIECTSISRVER